MGNPLWLLNVGLFTLAFGHGWITHFAISMAYFRGSVESEMNREEKLLGYVSSPKSGLERNYIVGLYAP